MNAKTHPRLTGIAAIALLGAMVTGSMPVSAHGVTIQTIARNERQLFVDRHAIAELKDAQIVMHEPLRREPAILKDKPWEELGVSSMSVFKDGDKFRAWYRADVDPKYGGFRGRIMAYAESKDGINWVKPNLGLIEFNGTKENNLFWTGPGSTLCVFKDSNPGVPADERYKAVGRDEDSLVTLVSADGIHWRMGHGNPIYAGKPVDTHSVAYWDEINKLYVLYTRAARKEGRIGFGMDPAQKWGSYNAMRWIRRATSQDFVIWTPFQDIDAGYTPTEHLYSNSAQPYPHNKNVVVMLASRLADARTPKEGWHAPGVNDIVLLTSRDGINFDRQFMEAFIRPGLDYGNWHSRSLYVEVGFLQTSPEEISFYGMENWQVPTNIIRRFSIRTDGFCSVRAGYEGGYVTTRPFEFTGDELRVNFSCSAVGAGRIEIQDEWGNPIPGFGTADAVELLGDSVDLGVSWTSGRSLEKLMGKRIRLKFELRDADLYSFWFR